MELINRFKVLLAALLYGQENLRLEEVSDPTPAAGEVVIQVGAATTCGTDLKVWRRGGSCQDADPANPVWSRSGWANCCLG
ncbi:hypothetical protein NSTCB13_07094 [Nostoc sp. DSM 114160]|jgi:L-iditol 2-dehydrogenase